MQINFGERLSDTSLKALEKIIGAHTLHVIIQQPTWNAHPLLDPAQMPLANNRRAPAIGGQTAAPATAAQPVPQLHYPQTRQPGAGTAAAPPGQPLTPFAQMQKAALDNMRQVAEAQVRLAASGIVSIDTLDQQAKALDFLTGRQKLSEEQTKRLGKDTVTLRDAFTGIQKSMVVTTATLAGTFASLKHMAGEAQPGLWRAMEGSMRLVTAQLGSALIPEMTLVTDSIMDVADWLGSMDESTRKLVAAGVIAIPATIGLGYAIRALAPAAHLARVGVTGLITALGPLGATVAAIGVAASMYAADYFYSRGRAAPEAEAKAGTPVTASEITATNLRVVGQLRGTEPTREQLGTLSAEELRQLSQEMRRLSGEHRNSFLGRNFPSLSGEAGLAANLDQTATILERMAGFGFKSEEHEKREAKIAGLMRQGRHYQMMITEARREQQPRYSGLEDMHKQVQLQILGKGPFEMELLRIQRSNLPKMVQQLNRVTQQLQELNNRGRAPGLFP